MTQVPNCILIYYSYDTKSKINVKDWYKANNRYWLFLAAKQIFKCTYCTKIYAGAVEVIN